MKKTTVLGIAVFIIPLFTLISLVAGIKEACWFTFGIVAAFLWIMETVSLIIYGSFKFWKVL